MPNIKFVVEADASKLVQGYNLVERKQEEVEKGFGDMSSAQRTAETEMLASLKRQVQAYIRVGQAAKKSAHDQAQAYELAQQKVAAVTTHTMHTRVRPAKGYDLASLPSPPTQTALIRTYSGGEVYETSDERRERVQAAWNSRRQARQNAVDDKAFADFARGERVRRRWEREERVNRGRAKQKRDLERTQKLMANGGRVATGITITGSAYLRSYLEEYQQKLQQSGDVAIATDHDLAPLYGVGDNATKTAMVRKGVMSASSASGISPIQIANAQFSIESAASNLPPEVRDAMVQGAAQFFKLQNTDMQVAGKALNKYFQIYGDKLQPGAAGIRQASNRIGLAADIGDFEIEDAANYLPDLLGSFRAMGYSDTDALSGLIVGSQRGGRMETTFTGLRNLALRAGDAEKKLGIKLSSDFPTMLKQVAEWKGAEKKEVFGAEAIAVAENLSAGADSIRKYRQELNALTGTTDTVAKKLGAAWMDAAHAAAQTLHFLRQGTDNLKTTRVQTPVVLENATHAELVNKGIEATSDPMKPDSIKKAQGTWAYWLQSKDSDPAMAGFGQALRDAQGFDADGTQHPEHRNLMQEAALVIGRGDLSGMGVHRMVTRRIQGVPLLEGWGGGGNPWAGRFNSTQREFQTFGQSEFEEYASLLDKNQLGPRQFTPTDYATFKQLQADNKGTAADQFIAGKTMSLQPGEAAQKASTAVMELMEKACRKIHEAGEKLSKAADDFRPVGRQFKRNGNSE